MSCKFLSLPGDFRLKLQSHLELILMGNQCREATSVIWPWWGRDVTSWERFQMPYRAVLATAFRENYRFYPFWVHFLSLCVYVLPDSLHKFKQHRIEWSWKWKFLLPHLKSYASFNISVNVLLKIKFNHILFYLDLRIYFLKNFFIHIGWDHIKLSSQENTGEDNRFLFFK